MYTQLAVLELHVHLSCSYESKLSIENFLHFSLKLWSCCCGSSKSSMVAGRGEYNGGGEKALSCGLEGGVNNTDLIRESLLPHFFKVHVSVSTASFLVDDFVLFLLLLFSLMQASGLASMNSGAKVQ